MLLLIDCAAGGGGGGAVGNCSIFMSLLNDYFHLYKKDSKALVSNGQL